MHKIRRPAFIGQFMFKSTWFFHGGHITNINYMWHLQNEPAPAATWVDHLPSNIRPYFYLARVHRPSSILLLFYPCGECLRDEVLFLVIEGMT